VSSGLESKSRGQRARLEEQAALCGHRTATRLKLAEVLRIVRSRLQRYNDATDFLPLNVGLFGFMQIVPDLRVCCTVMKFEP
jgi:hypothetical protein